MNTVLYFSTRGVVYETRAYSKADIAELVQEQGLQSLTSSDRQSPAVTSSGAIGFAASSGAV